MEALLLDGVAFLLVEQRREGRGVARWLAQHKEGGEENADVEQDWEEGGTTTSPRMRNGGGQLTTPPPTPLLPPQRRQERIMLTTFRSCDKPSTRQY